MSESDDDLVLISSVQFKENTSRKSKRKPLTKVFSSSEDDDDLPIRSRRKSASSKVVKDISTESSESESESSEDLDFAETPQPKKRKYQRSRNSKPTKPTSKKRKTVKSAKNLTRGSTRKSTRNSSRNTSRTSTRNTKYRKSRLTESEESDEESEEEEEDDSESEDDSRTGSNDSGSDSGSSTEKHKKSANKQEQEKQDEFDKLDDEGKLARLHALVEKSKVFSQIIADTLLENTLAKKKQQQQRRQSKEAGDSSDSDIEEGSSTDDAGEKVKTKNKASKKKKAENGDTDDEGDIVVLSRRRRSKRTKKDSDLISTYKDKGVSEDTKKTKAKLEQRSEKSEQPKLVTGAVMRDYQLEGLNWLKTLYENGLNGILADEMGLGKTLQSISFLAYLYENGNKGPFLIACPLSTVGNWIKEIEKFAPDLPHLRYTGSKDARQEIRHEHFKKGRKNKLGVVVTSYETILKDSAHLRSFKWKYLIVDEGHRLKNINSKLIKELKRLHTQNRLLLTGTPLQNNLDELWSLLNFILPDIFQDIELFHSWFDFSQFETSENSNLVNEEIQKSLVENLHTILKPFLLRRLKKVVVQSLPPKREYILYSNLSELQKTLYSAALSKTLKKTTLEVAFYEMVDEAQLNIDSSLVDEYFKQKSEVFYRGYWQIPQEHDAYVLDVDSDSEQHDTSHYVVRSKRLRKNERIDYHDDMFYSSGESAVEDDENEDEKDVLQDNDTNDDDKENVRTIVTDDGSTAIVLPNGQATKAKDKLKMKRAVRQGLDSILENGLDSNLVQLLNIANKQNTTEDIFGKVLPELKYAHKDAKNIADHNTEVNYNLKYSTLLNKGLRYDKAKKRLLPILGFARTWKDLLFLHPYLSPEGKQQLKQLYEADYKMYLDARLDMEERLKESVFQERAEKFKIEQEKLLKERKDNTKNNEIAAEKDQESGKQLELNRAADLKEDAKVEAKNDEKSNSEETDSKAEKRELEHKDPLEQKQEQKQDQKQDQKADQKADQDQDQKKEQKVAENGQVKETKESTPIAAAEKPKEVRKTLSKTQRSKLEYLWKYIKYEMDNKKFSNIMMQLRLICDSPYLFYYPWDEVHGVKETIVTNSGKMQILDQLLKQLFQVQAKENHKVLIFSQFTKMLDLLEDYCFIRGIKWCRLDGTTDQTTRETQINSFNKDPEIKIFLLSTRAGGLGINLVSADTVVLFDSDWNPQVDLQAMDRAHRIGQKNPVIVYRLATANTAEAILLSRADSKRKLEKVVIQLGKFESLRKIATEKSASGANSSGVMAALKLMLQENTFQGRGESDNVLSAEELEELTDRSEEAYKRTQCISKHAELFESSVSGLAQS